MPSAVLDTETMNRTDQVPTFAQFILSLVYTAKGNWCDKEKKSNDSELVKNAEAKNFKYNMALFM